MATPVGHANKVISSGAVLLHEVMGLDINDPETTWPGTTFSLGAQIHEDSAGNPLNVLLIILALVLLCCNKSLRHHHHIVAYSSALFIAYLLFSIYMKWEPWHNRMLLPLIILWSPVVALAISQIKVRWVVNIILIILIINSMPFLLLNESRPIIPLFSRSILASDRMSLYFANRPGLMTKYVDIAHHLKNIHCSNVALETNMDTWEYPLWVLLQKEFGPNIRIEHINVNNKSGKIPTKKFNYCEVVSIDRGIPWISDYSWGTKLDFSSQSPNAELYMIQGWSRPEDWGVWSIGAKAVVGFIAPQPTEDMVLELGEFRAYAGQPVDVVVNGEALYHFSNDDPVKSVSIPVAKALLAKKSPIIIEFLTPRSTSPLSRGLGDDGRLLGIGLHTLALMPQKDYQLPMDSFTLARAAGAVIVDFKKSAWPGLISKAYGLAEPEPWGTWSSSDVVTLEFSKPLPAKFAVHVVAKAFGPNVGKEFVAHVGDNAIRFTLAASSEERVLQFSNPKGSKIMKINVPSPCSPKELGLSDDERNLGIAFTELRIEPL
jgi:hypothetical protein